MSEVISGATTRREFLQGMSLSLSWVATMPVLSSASYAQSLANTQQKRTVVIYHDSAHFDDRGILDAYVPPSSYASSTRRYMESLSDEEFLRRHWFL